MSILSNILTKIFPGNKSEAAASQSSASVASAAPTSVPSSVSSVDVNSVVSGYAAKKGETLNWKSSIVDLLKALDLDSSLNSRKELAKELHFSGDTNDSASMNIWLHKQVMQKLAANGGKIPADLQH